MCPASLGHEELMAIIGHFVIPTHDIATKIQF
jgi:hypothetical protein